MKSRRDWQSEKDITDYTCEVGEPGCESTAAYGCFVCGRAVCASCAIAEADREICKECDADEDAEKMGHLIAQARYNPHSFVIRIEWHLTDSGWDERSRTDRDIYDVLRDHRIGWKEVA